MDRAEKKIEQSFADSSNSNKLYYSQTVNRLLVISASLLIVLTFFGVKAYYALHKPISSSAYLENEQKDTADKDTADKNTISIQVDKGERFKNIQSKFNLQNTYLDQIFVNLYFKISQKDKTLQAGYYEFATNTSLIEVINKISNGDVKVNKFQLAEGATVKNILATLKKSPNIVLTLPYNKILSAKQLAKILKLPVNSAEGVFFPDTYYYKNGESDKDILIKAYNNMQEKLNSAWNSKDDKIYNRYSKKYLAKPYDVLRLAAIVEKEAADKIDREKVAGVFLLRLNKNMRLQADPTVIYSLQDKFTGDLKRQDLKYDSPYNTYVKKGLPPAPISTVSLESINAVLHPNVTDKLFFVASGDGKTHLFSKNIKEHNALVKSVLLK